MSPLARDLVPFYCGAVGVRALRAAGDLMDESGWLRVELPVESTIASIGQLLRFGADIEVLEPADLREQVADALRRSAALYD
jgi:predicted DNA-binding transcriptional regulator YafY